MCYSKTKHDKNYNTVPGVLPVCTPGNCTANDNTDKAQNKSRHNSTTPIGRRRSKALRQTPLAPGYLSRTAVLFLELANAPGGIDDLLLARVERMTG